MSTATGSRPPDPMVSVVVPARNEARNLELLLPRLLPDHEVVLVDGHSTDDTVEVTDRLRPDATVLCQTRRGKGNALVCGFEAATGDVIVMLDADNSADPAEIPRFVDALVGGADFAKGTRFRPGGGSADITRLRAVGNRGLNLMANGLLHTRYSDLCYGYNAFWADILPVLALPAPDAEVPDSSALVWGDGFEIETVLNCRIARAGLSVVEVPSYEALRLHGVSNLNAVRDGVRVLRTIVRETRGSRTRPERRRSVARSGFAVTPVPLCGASVACDRDGVGCALFPPARSATTRIGRR